MNAQRLMRWACVMLIAVSLTAGVTGCSTAPDRGYNTPAGYDAIMNAAALLTAAHNQVAAALDARMLDPAAPETATIVDLLDRADAALEDARVAYHAGNQIGVDTSTRAAIDLYLQLRPLLAAAAGAPQ